MKATDELEYLLKKHADMYSNANRSCNSDYNTSAATTTSYHMPSVEYRIEGMLRDLFNMSCEILQNVSAPICKTVSESTARLETVLDTMPECEHDCKKCKYYIPGGVETCNNSKRIADFLIDNGIVLVTRPKD